MSTLNASPANDNHQQRRVFKMGDNFCTVINGVTRRVNIRKVYHLFLTEKELADARGPNRMAIELTKGILNGFNRDEAKVLNFRLSLIEDAIDSGVIETCLDEDVATEAPLAAAA